MYWKWYGSMPSLDRSAHLQRIEEALAMLQSFHARTSAPVPLPHQYVGTIIDNTVALLTAPANALDGGARRIIFDQDRSWLSLMQAVHRSFFSSIHTAVEAGLHTMCAELGVNPTSSYKRRMIKVAQTLAE